MTAMLHVQEEFEVRARRVLAGGVWGFGVLGVSGLVVLVVRV